MIGVTSPEVDVSPPPEVEGRQGRAKESHHRRHGLCITDGFFFSRERAVEEVGVAFRDFLYHLDSLFSMSILFFGRVFFFSILHIYTKHKLLFFNKLGTKRVGDAVPSNPSLCYASGKKTILLIPKGATPRIPSRPKTPPSTSSFFFSTNRAITYFIFVCADR